MITKERLEELIEQEATVWCVSELHGSNKLKLHSKDVKDSDCFHISKTLLLSDSIEFYDEEETYRVPFQLLFETKEDAEWHVEFKCIERPERLELPTWEEFISQKFVWFFDKNHRRCCLYYLRCSNQIFINVGNDVIEIGELTKENYPLACRKAKELFLGGSYERHCLFN